MYEKLKERNMIKTTDKIPKKKEGIMKTEPTLTSNFI